MSFFEPGRSPKRGSPSAPAQRSLGTCLRRTADADGLLRVARRVSRGLGVLLVLGVGVAACRAPMPGEERAWRNERESSVREELPPAARAHFKGLRFYAWDPELRFRTVMAPLNPPEPVQIAAANGAPRPAHRVGRLRLHLPGGKVELAVYQLDDLSNAYPDALFLPFRDAGAARDTYGAGRYIDLKRLAGGVVEVDFNRAYNPDCAYGISARCPITPAENTLSVPVRAGEMMPLGHG
jgi:uncharacterized protein (DUF1684 family)